MNSQPKSSTRLCDIYIMEREIHNDNDQHIIDITTDSDFSSGSSLDEGSYSTSRSYPSTDDETSDEGASSSTSGCACLWNTMELVVILVQIVAALIVLTLAKDEHPQGLLLTWLIGYTCGCITITLHILLSRFRKYNQIGIYSRTRMDGVMDALKMGIECFFVVWLISGIVWICDGRSSPSDAPKLYRLCVVFIACSCIRYAYGVLLCADSVGEEGLGGRFVFPRPSHDDCCCICLRKYGEEEGLEIRKLECSHVFHLECIDKWLRIKATCPLCQSQVR